MGLIQRKERLAQVGAAADRAASRPGQTVAFLKNELTIAAGRRRQDQAPVLHLQRFLQVLHMTGNVAFGEPDPLRQVSGREWFIRKGLQNHLTGSPRPFRWGRRFGHHLPAAGRINDRP